MASRLKTEALVEPSVLRWARETAGLLPEEAAHRLQTTDKRIELWESGGKRPSMSQLRKMAAVYKRLLSDFYLPEPPPENPLPHDFRRLPSDGVFHYSRPLRYQLRLGQQRRALALDLAAEQEMSFSDLPLFQIAGDTEALGGQVREFLHVSLAEQRTWREPRKSYNAWRSKIEAADVLVFQVTGVEPAEMLGFSFTEQPLPVIGVNRKLAPNGRTFTLLHEFAHILLRQSSLCDIEEDFLRPPQEQRTEIFCNAVAAAALVPREALLSEPSCRASFRCSRMEQRGTRHPCTQFRSQSARYFATPFDSRSDNTGVLYLAPSSVENIRAACARRRTRR